MADTSKVIIFNSPFTNQLAITMVSGRCDKTVDEIAKMTVPNGVKYKIINHSDSKLSSEIMIKENTQMAVRKFFKEKFGKKPRIVVHLIKACELGD